jgi:hypothetical protein
MHIILKLPCTPRLSAVEAEVEPVAVQVVEVVVSRRELFFTLFFREATPNRRGPIVPMEWAREREAEGMGGGAYRQCQCAYTSNP